MGAEIVAEVIESLVDHTQHEGDIGAMKLAPSVTSPQKQSQDQSSDVGSPRGLFSSPLASVSCEVAAQDDSGAVQDVSTGEDVSATGSGTSSFLAERSAIENVDTDQEMAANNLSDIAEVKGFTEVQEVEKEVTQGEADLVKGENTDEMEASIKEYVPYVNEILEEEAMEEISLEQDDELSASGVQGVPRTEPPELSTTDSDSSSESSEEESSPGVSKGAQELSSTGRSTGGSAKEEVQGNEQVTTAPTPDRSGAVIRLTRQMSRVFSGMGSLSPKFEIREAKELQEFQEKVKALEEELRAKTIENINLTSSFKEKESQLMNKIECLELANEQLLAGGTDSSIQLSMELTRLQRQNSMLTLRERELQFQISTQEMLTAQMLDKRSDEIGTTPGSKQLESKIAVLESKLAEAVEVSNMYKLQLNEVFDKQKSAQAAALLNRGDSEDMLKELQKLRKQTKEQELELQDLQDRFFLVSVRLAESVAQREELLMKMKRIQHQKHCRSPSVS